MPSLTSSIFLTSHSVKEKKNISNFHSIPRLLRPNIKLEKFVEIENNCCVSLIEIKKFANFERFERKIEEDIKEKD